MNYVIAICIAYMSAILIAVTCRLIISPRKEKLEYVKNFKRGKFALIFFAAIPLYYLAYRYNGTRVDGSFWLAIKSSLELVTLKYEYSVAAPLMAESLLYMVAIEFAYTLVAMNAVLFIFSLFGQFIMNQTSFLCTRLFRKRIVVVVGYNPNSIDIVKSINKKIGKAVLMGNSDSKLREAAFINRANYVGMSSDADIGKKIKSYFGNFGKKKVSVILNCEDDAESLRYVKQLCRLIETENLTSLPLTEDCGLHVYVLGSKSNESIFMHYVEQSKGLVKFINRHEQIAMDFVRRYPLTQFMTAKHIDYKTATVKNDINLNVFMIGFGNFNETLFLTSVSNNQFMTMQNGKLLPKPVNYHIYDRHYPEGKIAQENSSVHSRSLNHGYMRYVEFLKQNANRQSEYLEFVPNPANVSFHPCDISHPEFYASMRKELTNESSYNYVIVSFGADMENIELAEKLQQKFHEWNIPSDVRIFVKVRDEKLVREIKNDFEGDFIQIFGTNRSCVYNAASILNEKTEYMARLRHLLYIAEDEQKKQSSGAVSLTEKRLGDFARDKWYGYKQFQRESNVYACLSLKMKLQLLGYDIAEDGTDCTDEFESEYELGDKRTPSPLSVEGKTIWSYCNDEQTRQSVRATFAVQEHQRWNANMICNGVIPATKAQIEENGGRILDKRVHGNITTMSGLIEYRKIIAAQRGISEEQADVIRYDYQLMDDAAWLLHKCGYNIVKKK
ncbi:MAG: hypothetical protein J1G04_04695 [Clostridiales bacterium]|nr:hypothetical protein [Clostridiales bacterium]